MNPELKEHLLMRKFASIEYMEEFAEHYFSFIEAGIKAVEEYKKNPPDPNQFGSAIGDYEGDLKLWEMKVLPNFRFMYNGMREEILDARNGNTNGIKSAAGDLRGLGRSMDGIRESFMDAIDIKIKDNYFLQLKTARKKGNNIYYTLSERWKPGEILDEDITGPVDEHDLLRYLRPRENV